MRNEILRKALQIELESNNEVSKENYLENRAVSLNEDIKTLIKTRRICKRNNLDYSEIQQLINDYEDERKVCIDLLVENDGILNDILTEMILKDYLYKELNKAKQKELLDKIRNLYNRDYADLRINEKKGLKEWLRKLKIDNFYNDCSRYLEFELSYIKNTEDDWFDLYISIKDYEKYESVDITFEDGRITEIKTINYDEEVC